jgi:hypothetical protein
MFKKIRTAFLEGLKQFWLLTMAIFGLLIMVSSIVLAFMYLDSKPIAIIVTALGSCIGMTMLCKSYFTLLEINQRKNAKERLDNENLKQLLDEEEKENSRLLLEKERLERMRLDVTSIAPIFRLGLISVSVSLYDFMQKVHRNESVEEGIFIIDKVDYYDEYIGVVNKNLNAQLGIDMKKVRFNLRSDRIIVSGIESEFQGSLNEKTKWLLYELRQKKIVDGVLNHYLITKDDVRIQNSMIEQENSFQQRINLGLEFKNLDTVIQEMAKQFIILILSPLKKEIVFEPIATGGTTFEEFIKQQNTSLDTKIRNLENGGGKQ